MTPSTGHDPTNEEEVAERFEEAFERGEWPDIDAYLPADPGERPAVLVRLIHIDLERRLKAGQGTRVETYLRRYPELAGDRAAVLDLLAAEHRLRRRAEPELGLTEYQARFPDLAASMPTLVCDGPVTYPAGGAATAGLPAVPGYEILEELGQGGMGLVLKGRDRHMGRDVAVKLLQREYRGQPHLVRRFLNEARIHGRLQHPGIVPVYQLGELPSGSPYFTMKLVQGRTLAALLGARADPAQDLPRFLGIFEQVCQTLAYAHAQGVIHRDLKPGNVMVGTFGEVQVMDWGLAKVLDPGPGRSDAPAPEGEPAGDRDPADPGRTLPTRPGEAMGTPAYMPPEQARGEVERIDARSDVFGLGGILCEILTGEPPFAGRDRARACDHAEALGRLDGCGADAELVRLAKACLAPEPAARPNDAGVVAAAVTAYLEGVRERLRAAEVEQARAQARAQEARATATAERRARRRTAGLALAVLLLVVSVGLAAWWAQRQSQARQAEAAQLRADGWADRALSKAEDLLNQAKDDPLPWGDARRLFDKALAAAREAEDVAKTVGASASKQQQAADLVLKVEAEAADAARDRRLVTALLAARGPRDRPGSPTGGKESPSAQAEPSADEQFGEAFREWDPNFNVDDLPRAADLLRRRPPEVLTEVVAGLDEWTAERRRAGPDGNWQSVADLAAALDDAPDPKRRELRALLTRRDAGPVADRLRQLAKETNVAREPVLGLLTLARALREAGDDASAESLLKRAALEQPHQAVLHDAMGKLLVEQRPPRWSEAVSYFAAAHRLRPELGEALAHALVKSGRAEEGLRIYDELLERRPGDAALHFRRGDALQALGRYPEADAAYEDAIGRRPWFPEAFNNRGNVRFAQRLYNEAEGLYVKAIDQRRTYAAAHYNHGNALREQGKYDQAAEAYRQAILINHDYPEAFNNRGQARMGQRRFLEAERDYLQAIKLKPDYSGARSNLGIALLKQGRYGEAEEAFRAALHWNRRYPDAHYNYGNLLRMQKRYPEAEEEYRAALALQPDHATALINLGLTVGDQGRFATALEYLETGHAQDPKALGWDDRWLPECRRLLELDGLLSAVLGGVARPAGPAEEVELASLCFQYKRLYAVAGRLYEAAFDADPSLARDMSRAHLYDAARSAVLAAGPGEGRGKLPDEVLRLRRLGLRWLREDLALYARLAERGGPVLQQVIVQQVVRLQLAQWQQDADLASVRDRAALDRLPDDERQQWRQLWEKVAALRNKIEGKK